MPNFLNEGHRQIAKREIWVALWVSAWLTCRVHSVAQLRPSVPQPPSVASCPLALPLPWLPWLPTSRPEPEGLADWSGHTPVPSVTLGEFCVPFPTVFSAWVQHGPQLPRGREGSVRTHRRRIISTSDSSVLSRWFSAFALASFRPFPTLLLNTFFF